MDPFLRDDSCNLGDMVTDAAVRVLDEHGVQGLSVSAIARRLGVTPQAVTLRLGGPKGARHRVLQLATVSFCRRWERWIEYALLAPVPLPPLPTVSEEIRGVRVWLALHELARSEARRGNSDVGEAVSLARSVEREVVHRQLERWVDMPLPDAVAARICALTDGLRNELVAPSPAVDVTTAEAMLRHELDRVREDAGRPRDVDTARDLPYM